MKLVSLSRKTLFKIIFSLLLGVYFHPMFADTYAGPVFQVGWYAATQAKSQHIDIEGLIGDEFSVDHSTPQNVLVGLGYYFDGLDVDCVNLTYGFNAFYLAPIKTTGKVTQEDLFTNLSYQYFVTNYPIYLAGKAYFHYASGYDVTFDVGLGPNIIKTGNFSEKSLDDGMTIPDANIFSGRTVVTFSATTGIGFRINNVLQDLSLEIDYRFFYLGNGKLKKGSDQLINTLHTGNKYANALFLSISI